MNKIHIMLLSQMRKTEEIMISNNRYGFEYLEFYPEIFCNLSPQQQDAKRAQIQKEKWRTLFNYIIYSSYYINGKRPEHIFFMSNGTIIWRKEIQGRIYEISHNLANFSTSISITSDSEKLTLKKSKSNIEVTQELKKPKNNSASALDINNDGIDIKSANNSSNYGAYQTDYENRTFFAYHINENRDCLKFQYFTLSNIPLNMDDFEKLIKDLINYLDFNLEFEPRTILNLVKHIMGDIPVPAIENALRELTGTPNKNSERKRKKN